MENKNEKLLKEFTAYCELHSELRFHQALRNWMGVSFLLTSDRLPDGVEGLKDTFYFNNKND
mgnify:CR=1 FL=1